MAFIKRLFKNEGEAIASDPRLDAQFFNELQDEVISSEKRVTKIETDISDTGWIDIPLKNGWKEYSATYNKPQYRKLGNQVFLKGMLNGAGVSDNWIGSTPYKNGKQARYPVVAGTDMKQLIESVAINVQGNVVYLGQMPIAYVSLEGISFFID